MFVRQAKIWITGFCNSLPFNGHIVGFCDSLPSNVQKLSTTSKICGGTDANPFLLYVYRWSNDGILTKFFFAAKTWDSGDADCSIARVNRATHARAIAYWNKLAVSIFSVSPLVLPVSTLYRYLGTCSFSLHVRLDVN